MTTLNEVALILGISLPILFVVLIWTVIWKALALWRAARKNSPIWFIVLLVVNTLGILEILYLFVFSKMGKSSETKKRRG